MLKCIYTSLHKEFIMHRLNFTIDEALYEQATLILEANDKKRF